MLRELLDDLRRPDSLLWRRALQATITHGPDALMRYGPPLVGAAFAAGLSAQRRAVRDNLRLVMGPRGPAREAADVARLFANYASCLTEAFVAGSDRGHAVSGRCLHGERFVEAFAGGRGAILATAHTGGWQVASPILLADHGAELLVVMRAERDAGAQAITDEARARLGVRIAHVGDDPLSALPLLAHLRKGGALAMQMDRLPRGMRGRKTELFGSPFHVPEGPLRLASLSGAPIVPVFTRRVRYMEYEIEVGEPVRLGRRPAEAEIDAAARKIVKEMENFVRRNPTQWFHFQHFE